MGTAARTLDVNFRAVGVDAVRSGIRAVKNEAQVASTALRETGAAAEGISHGAIFGIAELTRGIGRIAETGTASSLAMRELSGGIMRLGSSFGAIAGGIGVVALIGGVIVEHFMKARDEIKKTEEQFSSSLANMANAGRSADLQKQLRDLTYGTPYDKDGVLQNPSAVSGAFQGSLADLRLRIARLTEETRGLVRGGVLDTGQFKALENLTAAAKPLEEQYRRLTQALLNVANQPASMLGLLPMKITAKRPETDKQEDKDAKELQKLLAFTDSLDRRTTLQEMGPRLTGGLGAYVPPTIRGPESLLGGKGPRVATIVKTWYEQLVAESDKAQGRFAQRLQSQLGDTFATSITKGIQQGLQTHSIAGAFRGLADGILQGLGAVFVQIGERALAGFQFIKDISDKLAGWDGVGGIAAALGLIALGTLMESAGSSSSHAASFGGGGFSGASGHIGAPITVNPGGTVSRASRITPMQPITVHATIIGKDDPMAQRQLLEMIARAQRRGTTSG